jgi:hypothetical protein
MIPKPLPLNAVSSGNAPTSFCHGTKVRPKMSAFDTADICVHIYFVRRNWFSEAALGHTEGVNARKYSSRRVLETF